MSPPALVWTLPKACTFAAFEEALLSVREALGLTLSFEEAEGGARYAVVSASEIDVERLVRELDEDAAVIDPPQDPKEGYLFVIGLAPPNEDWDTLRLEISPGSGDNWAAWGIVGRIGSRLAQLLGGENVTGDPPPWALAALGETEPSLPSELPWLAMRNVPPLPGWLSVGAFTRPSALALLERLTLPMGGSSGDERAYFLACLQREPALESPSSVEDFEPIAMVVRVLRAIRQSSGQITLVLKGVARARILKLRHKAAPPIAEIETAVELGAPETTPRALIRIARYYSVLLEPSAGPSLMSRVASLGPGALADFIAHYGHKDDLRAPVLRALDVGHRVGLICEAHVNALADSELH